MLHAGGNKGGNNATTRKLNLVQLCNLRTAIARLVARRQKRACVRWQMASTILRSESRVSRPQSSQSNESLSVESAHRTHIKHPSPGPLSLNLNQFNSNHHKDPTDHDSIPDVRMRLQQRRERHSLHLSHDRRKCCSRERRRAQQLLKNCASSLKLVTRSRRTHE